MKPQCIVMCVCMLSVCPSLEAWTFKYLQDLHVPFGYIKHLGTIWIPLTIRYFFFCDLWVPFGYLEHLGTFSIM